MKPMTAGDLATLGLTVSWADYLTVLEQRERVRREMAQMIREQMVDIVDRLRRTTVSRFHVAIFGES